MTDEQELAVALEVVALLQKRGVGLDDEMVRFVRAQLAADRPNGPAADPDVIDRGGPEPVDAGTTTVSGGVTIGDTWQTIREQV